MDWVPAARADVAPAMERIPSGLFVLTSGHADLRGGAIVRWVQQCSVTPPMVMIAVAKGHALSPLIRDSRSFAVCQLDPQDRLAARAFELQTPGVDPFIGMVATRTPSGCPVPARALGFIDCELARHVDTDGDCEIYVGVVHHASTLLDPKPGTACLCDGETAALRRAVPTATPARATAMPERATSLPRTPARAATPAAKPAAARKGASKKTRSRR
jgi:flavin reductase (DIM6/NTAB) family NADH-FMN oxidoreductase RutF